MKILWKGSQRPPQEREYEQALLSWLNRYSPFSSCTVKGPKGQRRPEKLASLSFPDPSNSPQFYPIDFLPARCFAAGPPHVPVLYSTYCIMHCRLVHLLSFPKLGQLPNDVYLTLVVARLVLPHQRFNRGADTIMDYGHKDTKIQRV